MTKKTSKTTKESENKSENQMEPQTDHRTTAISQKEHEIKDNQLKESLTENNKKESNDIVASAAPIKQIEPSEEQAVQKESGEEKAKQIKPSEEQAVQKESGEAPNIDEDHVEEPAKEIKSVEEPPIDRSDDSAEKNEASDEADADVNVEMSSDTSSEMRGENELEDEVEEIAEAGIATQDTIKTKKDYGNIDEESVKKNKIEAALFVAARPISIEEIMAKTDLKKKEIETNLFKLAKEYQARITALEIVRIGDDKFSLQIKPQYTEDVKKFASGGLLKEAVMRTLTIIAAKQPIPKAQVVKLRGAGAYDHIKELLQNELITEEKKGRSSELRTTDRFSDMFGLPRDITEMKRVLAKSLGIKSDKAEGQ